IAWSHELLDTRARTVLRRLSIFAGPFGLDAASAVAGGPEGDPVPSSSVGDHIEQLVTCSLLELDVDEDAGDVGYRMLDMVRQFARRQLDAAGNVRRVSTAIVSTTWTGSVSCG